MNRFLDAIVAVAAVELLLVTFGGIGAVVLVVRWFRGAR